MRRVLDVGLILGFLAVDFLFFHDIFKAGEGGHDLAAIYDGLPEHPSLRDLQPVVAEVRALLGL
jgi:hypothetical protein